MSGCLSACVSVYHVCAWFPKKLKGSTGYPGSGVTGDWVLGTKSGSSARAASALFTTEPSLQP